jgi:hypothetical protein
MDQDIPRPAIATGPVARGLHPSSLVQALFLGRLVPLWSLQLDTSGLMGRDHSLVLD